MHELQVEVAIMNLRQAVEELRVRLSIVEAAIEDSPKEEVEIDAQ
jgi:hypothetical protein